MHGGERSRSAQGCRAALLARDQQRHHVVLAPLRDPDGRRDGRRGQHGSRDSPEDPTIDARIWRRTAAHAGGTASNPTACPARRTAAVTEGVGMRRSQVRWWIAIGIAVITQTSLIGQVPTIAPSTLVRAPTIQPPPSGEIEVLPIRGNIYALLGAGANIVASVGPDGV